MLDILMNPGEMTSAHWMIIGILLILGVGILFFVYRTYLVIRESAKNKYKPNIGLSQAGKSPTAANPETGNSDDSTP